MQGSGNAVQRKIAGINAKPNTRDVEGGYARGVNDIPTSKIVSYKNPYVGNLQDGRKEGRGCLDSLTCTIVLLLSLVVLFKLEFWYVSTPKEIKSAQLQILDEEVIKIVRILKDE
eukprot:15365214-Ditylum_brightwellii.AAC.1